MPTSVAFSVRVFSLAVVAWQTVAADRLAAESGSGCLTEQCVEEAREAGLARAREIHSQDNPLQGWDDGAGGRVARAIHGSCDGEDRGGDAVGVPSEWKVCMLRGRMLANDLKRFKVVREGGRFGRLDMLRLRKEFLRRTDKFGLWVRVEEGVVVAFEWLGKRQFIDPAKAHLINFLSLAASTQVFSKAHTFEFVSLAGDACDYDPLVDDPKLRVEDYYAFAPMLKYSRDAVRCPHHIVVPVTPWVHVTSYHPPPPSAEQWAALDQEAAFAGTPFPQAPERTLLAIISHLKLMDGVRFTVRQCQNYCANMVDVAKKAGVSYVQSLSAADICKPVPEGGMCKDGVNQMSHKYLTSADGIGAAARLAEYLQAPGVVVELQRRHQWFFDDDLIPFVTYAVVSRELPKVLDSYKVVLSWLRKHDDVARNISNTATEYYNRHMTLKKRLRYFQLFAAVYNEHWDDSDSLKNKLQEVDPLNTVLGNDYKGPDPGLNCATMMSALREPRDVHPSACPKIKADNLTLSPAVLETVVPMLPSSDAPGAAHANASEPQTDILPPRYRRGMFRTVKLNASLSVLVWAMSFVALTLLCCRRRILSMLV